MINKLLLCCMALFSSCAFSQEYKLLTYNLRYDEPSDGMNAWSNRKNEVTDLLNYYQPDVFGTQEGLKHQLDFIKSQLNSYTYFGVGRDDGKDAGEHSAIFYNTTKLKLYKSGNFWLSPTPEKPSKGWDAVLPRLCTYGIFKDKKTKQKFMVFNAHFDHVGIKARIESVKLIVKKIKELNTGNIPAFFMGDLNLTPDTEPIKLASTLMHDSRTHSKMKPYGPEGTYNGFHFDRKPKNRIDYIFTTDGIAVKKYITIDDFKDFKYPSDHLPVMITAVIN
ncbi:endonuclease/exonuclease/phosphatase family protein [Zhouia sp. PK063]|uniref:endonuclease/exonuclease/phosphatase family protein n=1 Tax=Zhouia sp. PK063 TaxID=3373602 RepID=UPI0037BD92ED